MHGPCHITVFCEESLQRELMDSGSGRKREVMKGVIKHDSKEGRPTKGDGIHMFSHFFDKDLA